MALNQCTVMGRFTADPILKTTPSGVSVTQFTLAVERDFKGSDGEKQTDWIDVVCWRQTAEFACKYFAKGRAAAASGRLQTRVYTDKDGNKRKAVEIVADHLYFADSKQAEKTQSSSADGVSGMNQGSGFSMGGFDASDYEELTDDDGDLPF